MSTRGAVLLAIGMLVLGLLLGALTGGVAGYLAAQNTRGFVGQMMPFGLRGGQNVPNNRQPQNPNNTPRGNVPNQNNPNVVAGAQVVAVDPNSPAQTAGLQTGDIITAVDNTKVDATHSLTDLIAAHKPGDKVALSVTRNGQTQTINVTLGTSSSNNAQAYLGIRFAPVTTNSGTGNGNGNNFRRFQRPNNTLPNG